jgi:hypothetical protein
MNIWYVTIGYMMRDDIVDEVYLKQANKRQGFALEDPGGLLMAGCASNNVEYMCAVPPVETESCLGRQWASYPLL